jgi:alanyl-tRNA synthetase
MADCELIHAEDADGLDMLGHFSFYEGSAYETKRLMIESAWIFLIDYTKLCPNDLLATIHPEDNLSKKIWDYFGVKTVSNQNNTTITPNKKLCGVRTEIIWINPKTKIPIELWNIVFTQFQGTKIFSNPMKKIAADSGISIDRITTAAEYCCNDYENSTWKSVIDRIARITNNSDMTKIYRLSDLGKAATLLIFQGLYPGKKLANYVLRKIIREACIICYELQLPFEEFSKISSERWIQKNADQELVISILMDEFLKFNKAIQKGKKEYKKLITKKNSAINELDIKYLNSTFGYPKIMLKKEELYEK